MNQAALQFVRKITGFSKPSKLHEESFHRAVTEIADSCRRVLEAIETNGKRRDPGP